MMGQQGQGMLFIGVHQPRISLDVGGEYGGEFAFEWRRFHLYGYPTIGFGSYGFCCNHITAFTGFSFIVTGKIPRMADLTQ
ncbi:hypothetical protein, partial [Rhizobium leguminosarum]